MANSTLTRSLSAFPRSLETIVPWLRREVGGGRLPWTPFVTFASNASVVGQQTVMGTTYADLTDLAITVKLSVPMELLVVAAPDIKGTTVSNARDFRGLIEVDAGVIGASLPVQYGPYLARFGTANETMPMVFAAQFTLDRNVTATIKARASLSGAGDSYDVLGDGKSWMFMLGLPRNG